MSNVGLIIEERAANIGNFMVGRILPFREKRMVGPFIFIDHMGPVSYSNNGILDIGPHPHIGLSTLTYLLEGTVLHKDSIGSNVEISPGAVNWMTGGKGVVHSERTPERMKGSDGNLHGLQIWVALPKEEEDCEPNFTHVEANQLPSWEENKVQFKLLAGELYGKKSPVPVYSPLYLLEIKNTEATKIDFGNNLYGECGLYILEGGVKIEGELFGPKQLLVAKDAKLCSFEVLENTSLYLFGGEPFEEERFIHWNFVSSSREKITKAIEDWKSLSFPKINGEEDQFIPIPDFPFK